MTVNLRWKHLDLVIALSLLCAGFLLVSCQEEDDVWPRIEREGVLRVGLDPTFPPFELTEGSEVSGFDVDLARALANELGLEAEFIFFGYDGLYDALATEQVDILISALVIVPGRMRDFAYSEPYFNAGEILIVPASDNSIEGMDDLQGRRLAVELGAQGHVEATQWARRIAGLTIQPYTSASDAMVAVAAGDVDAALVDSVSGRLYLKDQSEPILSRVGEPVTVEPFAMVVRIEDETVLTKLDEALSSLSAKGELDNLVRLWIGP